MQRKIFKPQLETFWNLGNGAWPPWIFPRFRPRDQSIPQNHGCHFTVKCGHTDHSKDMRIFTVLHTTELVVIYNK
ncbi:hypothetical protein I7I48_04089 [Histoplasma ohiense]|nr:hypothetical protein I7I48_04089 [Histoplasma ohiense (nom. inval.)]